MTNQAKKQEPQPLAVDVCADSIKNGSSWDVFYKPKSKKTVDNSLYNFAKVLTNEVVKKKQQAAV